LKAKKYRAIIFGTFTGLDICGDTVSAFLKEYPMANLVAVSVDDYIIK
jgi:hypothetical protein